MLASFDIVRWRAYSHGEMPMTIRYAVTHVGGECNHVHTSVVAAQRCARRCRDAAVHSVDEAGGYSYVAPPAPGRRGRPRLRPDATAVQVTVTMPADLVARLDATPEGRTRSEKLRILTERGLADIANDVLAEAETRV